MDYMPFIKFFYQTEIIEGQPRFSFREAVGERRINEACLDFAEDWLTGGIYWGIGSDMAGCYRPLKGGINRKTVTGVLAELAGINHKLSAVDENFSAANKRPVEFILDAYQEFRGSLLPDES